MSSEASREIADRTPPAEAAPELLPAATQTGAVSRTGFDAARVLRLQASAGNAAVARMLARRATAVLARQPQPGQRATADAELGRTTLPLVAGGRTYEVAVVRREGRALVVVTLSGTPERFEVPLPGDVPASARVAFNERVIGPDGSHLAAAIEPGARALRVSVVPSPYDSAASAARPDRVRVFDGAQVLEKDVYPSGSGQRLSAADARFSTVVMLPPSGRGRRPAPVVLEVAPGVGGRGTALLVLLRQTGQRITVPVEGVDVTGGRVRLAGERALANDERGNAQTLAEVEFIDAAGVTTRVVGVTFISWRDSGARDEGYTFRVAGAGGGVENTTHGLLVPPVDSGSFHVRLLTDEPGRRETVSGDQEYNAQLTSAGGRGITLRFGRRSPDGPVEVWVSRTSGVGNRHFTVDYRGTSFHPRLVENGNGDQGRLVVSFDGAARDMMVAWTVEDYDGSVPFMESFDHVVLRPVRSTRVRLVISGTGIDTAVDESYSPPLPAEAIVPPQWRRTVIGSVDGWMRVADGRFLPGRMVDTQVAGAQVSQMLFQESAIAYVHGIPIVGELVMLGEAAAGREIITGRRLDSSERTLLALFGGLGLAIQGAAALRGLSGEARAAAEAAAVVRMRAASGLGEQEARALLRAAENVSGEDRAFIQALQRDVEAGHAIDAARAARLRGIVARLDQELQQARRGVLEALQARIEQIQSARGDLNVFRARFRAVTAGGDAAQDLGRLGPRLDELLTPYRRVRVVTGGGRGGAGVSTYIESLDERFSIRITHNQVGPNPIGNPPAPRIHLFEGPVSGHGRHVVLPNGTTLDDILRALGLAP